MRVKTSASDDQLNDDYFSRRANSPKDNSEPIPINRIQHRLRTESVEYQKLHDKLSSIETRIN